MRRRSRRSTSPSRKRPIATWRRRRRCSGSTSPIGPRAGANCGGEIIGVGTAGAASVPELGARGEILHLYVDPSHARAGIGRALMRRLALALKAQGYNGIALGVVEGNQPAIDFYKKLGGRLAGSYIDPGPLWRSRNQILIWDDIETLLN